MAIAFVQKQTARGSNVNTISATPTNSVVAGNALFVCYGHYYISAGLAAPTSSPSNTWSSDVSYEVTGLNSNSSMIASALNVASGSTTVTVDPGTGFYAAMSVSEFSGIATTNALDRTKTNNATSNSPTTGATASDTTQADELAIAVMSETTGADTSAGIDSATFGGTATGGSAVNLYVEQDSLNYNGHSSDYKILTGTGTVSCSWGTLDGSYIWSALLATYKAAASAGTVPHYVFGKPLAGPFGGPI